MEAVAQKVPVITGPDMSNFSEIAEAFVEKGALLQLNSIAELRDKIEALLEDEGMRLEIGHRAHELLRSKTGAAEASVKAVLNISQGSLILRDDSRLKEVSG